MNVGNLMTPNVETVTPDASVLMAARKMRDLNIGFLPVYAADQLVGVVTDRDIAIRAMAAGLDADTTNVSEIMTTEVVGCFEDQPVEVVAQLMNEHQIRRLVVLDECKKLIGVVSLGDLALDAPEYDLAGKVLQTVSWPARPERVSES